MTEIDREEMERRYIKFLKSNPRYQEAYEIGRQNSAGGFVAFIGGVVWRNLARLVHGEEITIPTTFDIDILIEKETREIHEPLGWGLKRTSYGDIYFERGQERIDLNDLQNLHSVLIRHLRPTIVHFLTGVPFNVQSVMFNYSSHELIARREALYGINHRVIKVGNYQIAKEEVERINRDREAEGKPKITMEGMLQEKADSARFGYALPKRLNR